MRGASCFPFTASPSSFRTSATVNFTSLGFAGTVIDTSSAGLFVIPWSRRTGSRFIADHSPSLRFLSHQVAWSSTAESATASEISASAAARVSMNASESTANFRATPFTSELQARSVRAATAASGINLQISLAKASDHFTGLSGSISSLNAFQSFSMLCPAPRPRDSR